MPDRTIPLRVLALAAAALVLAAAGPQRQTARPATGPASAGTPVLLQQQRDTPSDTAARLLVADDLAAATARGDKPLVLSATASLGFDRPALFVQLQSPRECGSAGCTTSVYAWQHGGWTQILDGTTGKITISPKRTRGHADLLSGDDHYVWTGTAYRSTQPAPTLDLHPRPRPRRR